MTHPCPAIALLARPGAPACVAECRTCGCAARVLGAMRPDPEEARDGRR